GGDGRAGLPLGLSLADVGLKTVLYDIDGGAVDRIERGEMPFLEHGADDALVRVGASGRLEATTDPGSISASEVVVIVVGTPVDERLTPDPFAVTETVKALGPYLRSGQLLVLRSTVYPGVTRMVESVIGDMEIDIDVVFCPERIAEGQALVELRALPQIISSRTARGLDRAEKLFRNLTDEIVVLEPEEAELAKLFTNTWRYIKFATANQLYMIANDYGLDYETIREAIIHDYPRAADLPGAGFAAGPCLFKDTAQLAAFNHLEFSLGNAAMMINEGFPIYVVSRLKRRFDLSEMNVGILGMAFKGESDDSRSSLSYKLKRLLMFEARSVLTTDPFVVDEELVDLDTVIAESDVLIVGAPHKAYRGLEINKPVADVWNILGQGVLT
ncbi:MAG: nucleotide sugar dehydrogenase, partial [Actinomycetota bacterium]|nr:nucleotide sugar dehydrogenase [Actinomycetota bacterium]